MITALSLSLFAVWSPLQDKSEADVERIKSTVMLSYGYVTLFAPSDIIASRVEANILRNINPHFGNVKVGCLVRLLGNYITCVHALLLKAVDTIGNYSK